MLCTIQIPQCSVKRSPPFSLHRPVKSPIRMAPASTTHLHTGNDCLQHAASPPALQPLSPRSGCEVSRSRGRNRLSNDWKLRPRSQSRRPAKGSTLCLPPDPTATTNQVSSSPANKRKASEDNCPRTTKETKTKALQYSQDTEGQAAEGKLLSAKLTDGVNSNNGTVDHIPYIPHQNSTYKGDKRTKRKPEASLLEDSPDSGDSSTKRHNSVKPVQSLTRENLGLLEESMPSDSANTRSKLSTSLSKRSFPEEPSSASSQTSRSLAATNIRFENELRRLNVDFLGSEEPNAEDITRLREVMEKGRDSPDPDRAEFHETRLLVQRENEVRITQRLTPLLWPQRELPSNNHKTTNLLYRSDAVWQNWCSASPGILPKPKPDFCITFKDSAFDPEVRKLMTSPYVDEAGFAPRLTCEVKTALQGPDIANRQNANNMLSVLEADFLLQQRLGRTHAMERKIRIITLAHNTRTQWYDAWFYALDNHGKPKWCSYRIKSVNFDVLHENGFETARQYNLNLCEHLERVILPELRADLAKVSTLGSGHSSGAMTLSGSNSGLVPGNRANTRSSTELETHPGPPLDDRHDPEADLQATSKRARVSHTVT